MPGRVRNRKRISGQRTSAVMTPRPEVTGGGEDMPLCWEILKFDYPGMGSFYVYRYAAALSGTHWYAYRDLPGATVPHGIWRWTYPDFGTEELVYGFPLSFDDLNWNVMQQIAYLNGSLYWIERWYEDATQTWRDAIRGGSLSILPITNPATVYEFTYQNAAWGVPQYNIVALVGDEASGRLFGLGYQRIDIDQPHIHVDQTSAVIIELFPGEPGRLDVLILEPTLETGYTFLEANFTIDGTGRLWFTKWGVGADAGRLAYYDLNSGSYVTTDATRNFWAAPDFFVGTSDGLLYSDSSSDYSPIYKTTGASRDEVLCLGTYDFDRGEFGAWNDDGPAVSFGGEVAWVHESYDRKLSVRHMIEVDHPDIAGRDAFGAAVEIGTWTRGGAWTPRSTIETATTELGEPLVMKNTVWWKWTAPKSGLVAFNPLGVEWEQGVMHAYTGSSVSSLTFVAEGRGNFSTYELRFDAKQGTTYYIRLGAFGAL
jgi:hypothetical protein